MLFFLDSDLAFGIVLLTVRHNLSQVPRIMQLKVCTSL